MKILCLHFTSTLIIVLHNLALHLLCIGYVSLATTLELLESIFHCPLSNSIILCYHCIIDRY